MNILIFSIFSLFSMTSLAADEQIKVLYLKGEVICSDSNGQVNDLTKDEEIFTGDQIITKENSYAILRLLDNSVIKVEPNSSFVIENVAPFVEGKSFGVTETILKKGRAFFEIPNKEKQEILKIKVGSIALGVRGTNFLVDIERENVWVGVEEGEVELYDIADDKKKEVVLTGEAMKVEERGRFTKPKSYQWLKDINFKSRDIRKLNSGFTQSRESRKKEFKIKREDWKYNSDRFEKRSKLWQKRKAQFRNRYKNVFANLSQRKKAIQSRQLKAREVRLRKFKERFKKIKNLKKQESNSERLDKFRKKIKLKRGQNMENSNRNSPQVPRQEK